MSKINVIKNSKFEEGLNDWSHNGTYDGNTIEIMSSAGVSGNSARLSVPKELGMTYIGQKVNLLPGTYEVSFKAKKVSGNADVWICVNANNKSISSPSFLPKMSTKYVNLTYTFSVTGSNRTAVTIFLIAGSIPGVVDFDDVVLMADDESTLLPNKIYYADVTDNCDVHAAPKDSTVLGHWQKGRLGVVKPLSNNTDWLLCHWKKKNAYVEKKYLTNFRTVTDTDYETVMENVIRAETKEGVEHRAIYYNVSETVTDENGKIKKIKWCHLFADWLIGHSAWTDEVLIPDKSRCKDGVIEFIKEKRFVFVNPWHKEQVYKKASNMKQYMDKYKLDPNDDPKELNSYEESYIPSIGDYIYLRNTPKEGDEYDPKETSCHVGIVTKVEIMSNDGIKVTAIEGNKNKDNPVGEVSYEPTPGEKEYELNKYNRRILGFGETIPVRG